ncbi:MAG TPA: glycosyltransferase family 4 protein [Candidatus Saccharimonadales bacterium]|nr:glycosyltransferase family 4 protein [Candidatus Saccharimonadales bacterium]
MNKPALVVVAPYFPPYGGGLERYAYEMARRMHARHEWRVVVITSGEQGGEDEIEQMDGLTVYRLAYSVRLSNTPFGFGWLRKIRRILREEKPTLVNVHTPVAGLGDIASLACGKTPLVVTYHAGSMKKGKLLADVAVRLYERIGMHAMLRKARRIVCSSDFVREQFLGDRYAYKSVTAETAVSEEWFATPQPATRTVLFAAGLGSAERHKGLDVLLDAMATVRKELPDARLKVVGDGDMKDEYQARAAALGLSEAVAFTGRLQSDELRQAYRSAAVFALPTANDSLPGVILEAMASGLPVVATPVGSIPSVVVDGQTGYLMRPRDSKDLAKKLIHILSDGKTARRLGRTGRKFVRTHYSWDERAERIQHIFVRAAGSTLPHTPRVLMVAPYYWPKIGGLENYAQQLAKHMPQSGEYEVEVITTNHETSEYRQDIIDGIVVHRLAIWRIVSNTPVNFAWRWQIKRIIHAYQPDIVHAHSPVPFMADMAAWAAGRRPFMLTYHAGSMRKGGLIDIVIGLYERIFLRALFRRADSISAVSAPFAGKELARFADKTYLLPPGVDTEHFRATPVPADPRVLFVGRIEHSSSWKGIEPLLKAMAIVAKTHPRAKLELVGGGDATPHFKQRVAALKLTKHVVFSGPLGGDDLAAAYRRSKMLVLPSTSEAESFGMVLIEAMASGRPVIGSRVGGIPYVIDNKQDGLLTEPNNPDSLADAIKWLLDDQEYCERLAVHGRAKVETKYTWHHQCIRYGKLYKRLLMDKPTLTHLVGYYPPHLGGMEVVTDEVTRELARQGYRVRVLTSGIGSNGAPSKDFVPGLRIERLKAIEAAHTPIMWSLPLKLLRLPRHGIVHVHVAQALLPELAMLAAKVKDASYVAHFHLDVGPSGPLGKVFLLYKRVLLGPVLRRADAVIVFSEEQAALVRRKHRVAKDNIVIVPNGVSESFFYRRKRSVPVERLELLFVGRLAAQKRVERLLKAMAQVTTPVHLTIVGDGEERIWLEELAKKLGLTNVTFAGKQYGDDLRVYLRKADMFVLPSDREGMPLVVLEAMAAGLPIMGSNVLGIRELVSGVGILVDKPSPRSFARAINDAWKRRDQLPVLSKQSLTTAEAYSWKRLVGQLDQVYQEIRK